MKRSPLKSMIPLRRKTALKSHTGLKAYKPLNNISQKQKSELKKRVNLKRELIAESPKDERGVPICSDCGKPVDWDWRSPNGDLSHTKRLSQGGKTKKSNSKLLCRHCHNTKEHNLREIM